MKNRIDWWLGSIDKGETLFVCDFPFDGRIHVIRQSEYDKLQMKLDETKVELECVYDERDGFRQENKRLRDELERALKV